MNYKELNGQSIRDGFNKFNQDNPHIFISFEKQAFKEISSGKKKISAKLIINKMRWQEPLESSDKNFKINDAYQSYYARFFIEKHPEHIDIFEFRKLRNEESGPYMVENEGQLAFL
jgi:hypothetical protein